MKQRLILALSCSAALTGCTPGESSVISAVAPPAAIYGATAAVANPPDNVEDTADKIGKAIQSNAAEAKDHMDNFGSAAKEGTYQATDHIADWIRPSKPKPPPQAIAASYCYRVYEDILCYRQPMPGAEARLVAYQPLGAPPPKAVETQLLPQRVEDASQQPANRVASAKPVFTQLPKPAANVEKTPEDGTAPAAASETQQLPDPATAPQL